MGYLICKECGMQYKLKEGENAEDFEDCECGGELKEVENLDEINDPKPDTNAKEIKYSIWTGKPIKPQKPTNSQDIICQKCGAKNPNTAKFCTECASPLNDKASKKLCSQCGTENPPEAQYCQECATNLKSPVVRGNVIQHEKDKGLSGGETVVICLFSPIAGAIAYLIWHDTKPKKANQSCIIAIVAFVVVFVIYFVGSLIYRAYFAPSYIDPTQDIDSVRGSVTMILPLLM